MTNDVDPRYEENFVRVGSFLDMEIFRNRRIGTYNLESILLRREVPPPETKDPDYRTLRGSLAPGVSTCVGCSAPVVFNLVAKAAQMRPLFLRKALIEEGIFTDRDLDRPGVMSVLLNEAGASKEAMEAAGVSADAMKRVEEVRRRLIEEGLYFKLMFAGATGCMTVTTASYPNHIWRFPYFHSAFENIGAMVAGLEAGARARMRDGLVKTPHKVIGFAGDGGTFDIGLQALSGLWERNQDTLSITYDNEAYMNTGKQRCSSTPWGADTTTAPVGKEIQGKQTNPKDIISIALSHNIPYVATASPDDAEDLMIKVRKALLIPGAAYLRILAPCPPGWTFGSRNSIKMAEEAIDTAAFFSFECETDFVNRKRYFTINNIPDVFFDRAEGRREIADYAGAQGRFRHVFREKNEAVLSELQGRLDAAWYNFAEFFGLARGEPAAAAAERP
jgi:pyruvate ferredoxin oxidoreductase beta subunit